MTRFRFALFALVVCLLTGSSAQARTQHGIPAAAVTGAALTSDLQAQTGESASQVTAENVCPQAPPGYASCVAQELVTRVGHHRVVPLHLSRSATEAAVGPMSEPAGQTAPVSGTPAFPQQAYDLTWLSATAGVGDTVAIVDAYDDPNARSPKS